MRLRMSAPSGEVDVDSRMRGTALHRAIGLVALIGVMIFAWFLVNDREDTSPRGVEQDSGTDGTKVRDATRELAAPADEPRTSSANVPQDVEQANPAPPSAEDPPWRSMRLAEIDSVFDSLRAVRQPDSESDLMLHQFLWLAIAPLQDAAGQYIEPAPNEKVDTSSTHDEHIFGFRNRIYRLPRGQYPEYDEMMDRWIATTPSSKAMPGTPREYIALDPAYLDQLEALKERAKIAIRRRQDPY